MAKLEPNPPKRLPNITYYVTEEIFESAKRNDSQKCLIAEAIKAGLPGMLVEVDMGTVRIDDLDNGIRHILVTPDICRDAILTFDHGSKVKPFSFKLKGHDWMTAIHQRNSRKRTAIAAWHANKKLVKKIREERNLTWDEMGQEIGVSGESLQRRTSNEDRAPGGDLMNAVDDWVVKQTGKPPAPAVKSQAELAAGRVRKSETSDDIIGGRPPKIAKNMRLRRFGVRAYDWKPSEEETK